MRSVEATTSLRTNYYNANPVVSREAFAKMHKTSDEIYQARVTEIVESSYEFACGEKVVFGMVIDGKKVLTPALTEDEWDAVTLKNWDVFYAAHSAGSRKILVGTFAIVVVTNGVVNYADRPAVAVSSLFEKHGMKWNSLSDLIEYDLRGATTDTSLAAKKVYRDRRDAERREKERAIEAAKAKLLEVESRVAAKLAAINSPVVKSNVKKGNVGKGFKMPSWKVDAIVNSNKH